MPISSFQLRMRSDSLHRDFQVKSQWVRESVGEIHESGQKVEVYDLRFREMLIQSFEIRIVDFVRTARASGLSPFTVIVTYAFRNAMLPVITTLGMVFSFLLGANVLVEKVFAWPGIGSFAVEALIASDFAPVQGFVLTMAVMYVALNLLIDILYGLVDPRVRIEA